MNDIITFDAKTERDNVLRLALNARVQEVMHYQIDIDNYRRAVEKIGDDEQLQDFKSHLLSLLESSILEQRKAKIILEVIAEQLGVQYVG